MTNLKVPFFVHRVLAPSSTNIHFGQLIELVYQAGNQGRTTSSVCWYWFRCETTFHFGFTGFGHASTGRLARTKTWILILISNLSFDLFTVAKFKRRNDCFLTETDSVFHSAATGESGILRSYSMIPNRVEFLNSTTACDIKDGRGLHFHQ